MTEGNSLTDLLTIYLYQNKYLSLPNLGRFEVSEKVDLSHPENTDFSRIPQDGITFLPNAAEGTDTDLVRYITEHTRKMQSLAVADLFTLTDQARQILNIYQPVSFDGIGTLNKSAKGEIEFTPGVYRSGLLKNYNEAVHLPDFSEPPPPSVSSAPETHDSGPSRSLGGVMIIVICLIVAAVLLYFMVSHRDANEEVQDVTEEQVPAPPVTDSIEEPAEPERGPDRTGIIHYEVVFEHHVDSARAFHRYNQLTGWGHEVIMRTKDSVYYTLAIPFTSPAADTAQMKDSIRILYGRSTTIRYPVNR